MDTIEVYFKRGDHAEYPKRMLQTFITDGVANCIIDNETGEVLYDPKEKTIDIDMFLKQFNKEYEFMYDNNDNVAGEREAIEAFDEFLPHHKEFVNQFNKHRGDIITSDREAAAFMFSMEHFGLL